LLAGEPEKEKCRILKRFSEAEIHIFPKFRIADSEQRTGVAARRKRKSCFYPRFALQLRILDVRLMPEDGAEPVFAGSPGWDFYRERQLAPGARRSRESDRGFDRSGEFDTLRESSR
jgi:hypothetical protein